MSRTADCYIKGFKKSKGGRVEVKLQPVGLGFSTGWLPGQLKSVYTWYFDPNTDNILDLFRLYVECTCDIKKIPNSQCHEQFKFDDQGNVIGLVV